GTAALLRFLTSEIGSGAGGHCGHGAVGAPSRRERRRRARRRADPLRGPRRPRRRPHRPAAPHLVARALAVVARAGALPRQAHAGGDVRRSRQRRGGPTGRGAAYTDEMFAAAAAVLDATGTAEAVVVGFSSGVAWSIHLAANHPERVRGIVALGPLCQLDGVTQDRPGGGRRRQLAWDAHLEPTEGWA